MIAGFLKENYARLMIGFTAVVAIILTVWALKVTKIVMMPLAFSVFLMMIVYPVDRWFKRRLPSRLRWIAIMMTVLLILVVLSGFAWAIWVNVGLLTDKLPHYTDSLLAAWRKLSQWASMHNIDIGLNTNDISGLLGRAVSLLTAGLTSLGVFVGILVLIFFLTIMLLLEVNEWRDKLEMAFGKKYADSLKSTLQDIASKVRRFMLVRTFISSITGLFVGLWLWVMGVDLAFLWGFLAFLLNYIPTFGSIIAVIPPSLLSLLQYDVRWALLTIAGLTMIQQVIGNYIDPRLQGRALSISPMILLLSLILWGWVWGLSGTLLAVPLTVTIIVSALHIPVLKPLALLLSRPPKELLCERNLLPEEQCRGGKK